jgi:hypothetical protein
MSTLEASKTEISDSVVTATITQDHVALLFPAIVDLEPVLTYCTRTFAMGGPTGWQESEQVVRLAALDHKGRLAYPAGLLGRVSRELESAGYTLRISDMRPFDPRMVVDPAERSRLGPDESGLLDAVARNPLGRIEVANASAAVDQCLLLIRSLPRARFTVGVPTRSAAWSIWRQMAAELGTGVRLVSSGVRKSGERVVVGTLPNLTPNTVRRPHVLLLPFAERSTGERAIDAAVGAYFKRIYDFVRHTEHPDRHIQLRLEQLAGPVIVRRHPEKKSVRVVMLPAPDCGISPALWRELDRKYSWYWSNTTRNRAVAEVALGLRRGDLSQMRRVGLNPGVEKTRQSIAILVESMIHARAMSRELPGWPTLTLNSGGERNDNSTASCSALTSSRS